MSESNADHATARAAPTRRCPFRIPGLDGDRLTLLAVFAAGVFLGVLLRDR